MTSAPEWRHSFEVVLHEGGVQIGDQAHAELEQVSDHPLGLLPAGVSSPALFFFESTCFHGGFRMYHALMSAMGEKTTV